MLDLLIVAQAHFVTGKGTAISVLAYCRP